MAVEFAIVAGLLHLVPRPGHIDTFPCSGARSAIPRTVAAGFDLAARIELDERWRGLGIGGLHTASARNSTITVRRNKMLAPQSYRLTVASGRADIESADSAGAFYAMMTLAQLPMHVHGAWKMPCVRIEDRPALKWRILSDDVSRGPLPTMRYFEERIRTIAAFKMNGYSPYMEHVFVSPTDPLPAPLDGITAPQLHELSNYAARFHVALIPEQQSFAHMHNTLRVERYAPAAEFPHAFLLSPNVALSLEYLARIIGQELAAVGRPAFFHIGSDETATLGQGQTQPFVAARGRSQVYADHIVAMDRLIAPSGARLMMWDDGIENDPGIMKAIPRSTVVVNWHYGAESTFEPYISTIERGGLEQMVAPGASNWNEIFPNVDRAIANERRFINQGKAAHVLGVFETVWHDDGETLYEATWYPVLYAAAAGWQSGDVSPLQFAADFPSAFFGIDDATYSKSVDELGDALRLFEAAEKEPIQTDVLFWHGFFGAAGDRPGEADARAARLAAESVEQALYFERPPLHPNAAFVMLLAARRYDAIGRKLQIAREVPAMYADAIAYAATDRDRTLRDLLWCRYWMWELRDSYEQLASLYSRAWRYESRDGHLASNLERYHLAAQKAIELSDAFYLIRSEYLHSKSLPPFQEVISR